LVRKSLVENRQENLREGTGDMVGDAQSSNLGGGCVETRNVPKRAATGVRRRPPHPKRQSRSTGVFGRLSAFLAITMAASVGAAGSVGFAGASPAHKAKKEPPLYKLLPAKIRSSGTLVQYVTDIFPPMAMATHTGSGATGVDLLMSEAVAKVIGVKLVTHIVTTFSELFPAITTGRAEMEFTATFDSPTRYKLDYFVDYFRTGTQLYIPKSEAGKYKKVTQLCGHTIAGETGTLYQPNLTAAFKKICKGGTGLSFVNVPGIPEQNTEMQEGRAQAAVAGPESVDYLQITNPGQYERIGPTFYPTYYGVTLPNSSFGKQLGHVIALALDEIIKNGTYMKILKKYDVQSQAVTKATINKGTTQP
jgi:polar amino acid transport system substrate-binding protein